MDSPPARARDLFGFVFSRAYAHGRRWDEALWRYHELSAIAAVLAERPLLRDGPILDVGCGDGTVFEWLFGQRDDAYGVDDGSTRHTDVEQARRGARYAEVRLEDARRTSFEDGRFQLVFSNSVLEHIEGSGGVLAEAFRTLAPGGTLLFTTPDPALYSREVYSWRRRPGRPGIDAVGRYMVRRECDVYAHVSIHDAHQWRQLLRDAGFTDLDRRGYVPASVGRAITRFSGPTRAPLVHRYAWMVSEPGRRLSRPGEISEDAWVDLCRRALDPLLSVDGPTGGPMCGQLWLATRPS